MNNREIEKISKALGDPYRLKILEAVKKEAGWMPCSAVIEMLNLSQSTVSHHLKQLIDADLLVAEKEGRCARYTINHSVFCEYLESIARFCKAAEAVATPAAAQQL